MIKNTYIIYNINTFEIIKIFESSKAYDFIKKTNNKNYKCINRTNSINNDILKKLKGYPIKKEALKNQIKMNSYSIDRLFGNIKEDMIKMFNNSDLRNCKENIQAIEDQQKELKLLKNKYYELLDLKSQLIIGSEYE